MTLNQLFDKESGFLSEDEITLSADDSVLKETFVEANSATMGFLGLEMDLDEKKEIFMWKMEIFLSFQGNIGYSKSSKQNISGWRL